jgi:hypothetical protein
MDRSLTSWNAVLLFPYKRSAEQLPFRTPFLTSYPIVLVRISGVLFDAAGSAIRVHFEVSL